MIIGVGIDLVQLDRIGRMHDRFGERLLKHILTPAEAARLPGLPVPYIGSRFAAKEAAVKALGCGFANGITPYSIEVASDARGKPSLKFFGMALARAMELGVQTSHLSLSHEKGLAIAMVILEG